MLRQAGIALTDAELDSFEVAEFGLGDLEQTGLELVVYIHTDRFTPAVRLALGCIHSPFSCLPLHST